MLYIPVHPIHPPSPSHISISQSHHLAHSPHRWPGREAEAGASRQLALSGRNPFSLWRKGVMDTAALGIQSLSETTAAPQPHLTCLFLLRFLRVAVASPFNERVQNARSTTKRFCFFSSPREKKKAVETIAKSQILQLQTGY